MRHGARTALKWYSAIYVVAIVVQLFLAGEGIFRLNNIKNSNDCDKKLAHCVANSKTLDAHRALGFLLTLPGAILFVLIAALAWPSNRRVRAIAFAVPVLAFLQIVWAAIGGWAGGIHVLDGVLVLALGGWLAGYLWRSPEAG